MEKITEDRKTVLLSEQSDIIPLHNDDEESNYSSQVISPIISEGDAIGSVIIVAKEGAKLGDLEVKLSETAAGFLGRQMEQ